MQCEGSHVVLQLDGHGGHNGGGPLHYAFTVTEEAFDRICDILKPDGTGKPTVSLLATADHDRLHQFLLLSDTAPHRIQAASGTLREDR